MKKALLGLVLVGLLAVPAMADSIVLGFGVEPVVGAPVSLSAGYAGPNWVALGQKADTSSFYGVWSLCVLWNPVAGQFGSTSAITRWRLGGTIGVDWEPTNISFGGATLIGGAQIDWSVLTAYLQLVIGGSKVLTPQIGVELRIPLGDDAEAGE